ncbi:MAG: hypothetical protein AAB339_07505, partial [Elusimicrobiota bacterium]
MNLSWTQPYRALTTEPSKYSLKVSTLGNIGDDAEFEAAQPLSVFTETSLPAVGAGGTALNLVLTGLEPFTTYYFALRAEDSGGLAGKWLRDELGRNTTNFTVP